MRAIPAPFISGGQVETDSSDVVGISFSGFTSVSLYNGTSAAADLAVYCPAPGNYSFSYELDLEKGLFLVVAGSGKGTIWLA